MKNFIYRFLFPLYFILVTPSLFSNEFSYEIIVSDIDVPWGFVFLEDYSLLITDRKGQLIHFKNGKKMCLVDYRKFGKVWITENIQEIVGHLGIEPLSSSFTQKKFTSLLSKRSGTMKPLLLNQQFIAGIGNYLGAKN